MRGLPEQTNFPVPHNLCNPDSKIPDKLCPGFIAPMADIIDINKSDKSFNLSCDLKKINPSKSDDMGSVNLAGFEPSPTKCDIDNRMTQENVFFDETITICEGAMSDSVIGRVNGEITARLSRDVDKYIPLATTRIWELRDYVAKKEYALQTRHSHRFRKKKY